MTERHAAVRMCIGCRGRGLRASLVRLVARPIAEGRQRVEIDPDACAAGRGIWLHPNERCLALAQERRSFRRGFRAGTEDRLELDDLASRLAAHLDGAGHVARPELTLIEEAVVER